jgi:hypothetical protein
MTLKSNPFIRAANEASLPVHSLPVYTCLFAKHLLLDRPDCVARRDPPSAIGLVDLFGVIALSRLPDHPGPETGIPGADLVRIRLLLFRDIFQGDGVLPAGSAPTLVPVFRGTKVYDFAK